MESPAVALEQSTTPTRDRASLRRIATFNQTSCGTIEVVPAVPEVSDISIQSCGVTESAVSEGSTVRFEATIANDALAPADVRAQWFVGGVQIVGVVEAIGAESTGTFQSGEITWNELQRDVGIDEFDVEADIIEVFEEGTFTQGVQAPTAEAAAPASSSTIRVVADGGTMTHRRPGGCSGCAARSRALSAARARMGGQFDLF